MKLYQSDYALLSDAASPDKCYMDHNSMEARQRIWALRDAGLLVIREEFYPNSIRRRAYIAITDAGRDALIEKQRVENKVLQNVAKQQADNKARKRSALKNAFFNIFIALVSAAFGSFVTFILDHNIDIVAFIQSLFH